MNTNTLEIYRGEEAIAAAEQRGEPIITIGEKEATLLEPMNRAQRREWLRNQRRNAKRQGKRFP